MHDDALARLDLALAAFRLKDELRSGWVMHGVREPESVAAHSWGTAYLCLLFADLAGVDVQRALAIAVMHDLAEAKTGDFASRAAEADKTVTDERKSQLERAAIEELLRGAPPGMTELWEAYEDRADPAALFVRDMNLIDMCLQALRYEVEARYDADAYVPSSGAHRHLDEFFLSAERRLSGDFSKRLYGAVKGRYDRARAGVA